MKMIFVSARAANDPSAFIISDQGRRSLLALSHLKHYAKQALTHGK